MLVGLALVASLASAQDVKTDYDKSYDAFLERIGVILANPRERFLCRGAAGCRGTS